MQNRVADRQDGCNTAAGGMVVTVTLDGETSARFQAMLQAQDVTPEDCVWELILAEIYEYEHE